MMAKIRFSIENRLENVRLVGMAVNRLCLLALDQSLCDEVELAVVEAVTNCIKHAYPQEAGYEVNVLLEIGSQTIALEIRDKGLAIDPFLQNNLGVSLLFDPENIDTLPESGMGWFIIKQLMDEVSYCSDEKGNALRLTKIIPLSAPEGRV